MKNGLGMKLVAADVSGFKCRNVKGNTANQKLILQKNKIKIQN